MDQQKTIIKQYAELHASLGLKRKSFPELIQDHGIWFTAGHRPIIESSFSSVKKECFKNATLACMASGGKLTYVEGFIFVCGIPIQHAWCLTEAGEVFDPTLDEQENEIYVGLPIDREVFLDLVSKAKFYGLFGERSDFQIYEMKPEEYLHKKYAKKCN